jgi:phage head maturation protease
MPYESPAVVQHHGWMVEEVVSFGAFDEAELRASRVRVNRDHVRERTVGRAVDFDAYNPAGLIAALKIAETKLGDETLGLARDDCLDASAAFAVAPGGETWEGNRRRRLTSLILDHIALTPDPAYKSARVLAVRGLSTSPAREPIATVR